MNGVKHDDEHNLLVAHLVVLPDDYDPWGLNKRWADSNQNYPDCASGCKHARWLEGTLGADWCVCVNPKSHRAGLLTFEHQGCQKFEVEDGE